MKTKISIILCLVLAVSLVLSGCADGETVKRMEADTSAMIDCIISGDRNAAYEIIKEGCSREDFDEFFDYIRPFFEGFGEYELKQTGWETNFGTSGTTYTMNYSITSEDGKRSYSVTASSREGTEGLIGFSVE